MPFETVAVGLEAQKTGATSTKMEERMTETGVIGAEGRERLRGSCHPSKAAVPPDPGPLPPTLAVTSPIRRKQEQPETIPIGSRPAVQDLCLLAA